MFPGRSAHSVMVSGGASAGPRNQVKVVVHHQLVDAASVELKHGDADGIQDGAQGLGHLLGGPVKGGQVIGGNFPDIFRMGLGNQQGMAGRNGG